MPKNRMVRIVGGVVVLLLLVLIAIPFFFDANSFRPRLQTELRSALGRQVKVGNLRLAIFSGSVTASDVSASDDPKFSSAPFLTAKSLNVGVQLMPLIFSKELHITGITIKDPHITLLRAPDGRWNYSSIGSTQTKPPEADAKSSSTIDRASVSVAKLDVVDGTVTVGTVPSTTPPHTYSKVNIKIRDFSFANSFPFEMSAVVADGGVITVDGTTGPINASDASDTPLKAKLHIAGWNLARSGFLDPSSGIDGLVDVDGQLNSNGKIAQLNGSLQAAKLKLSPKGAPAARDVTVQYALNHDLKRRAGTLTQGDVAMGRAVAHLTGSYQTQDATTSVNMKLTAPAMPVDELVAMLPALGVILPSGSQLKGGTLSADLTILGPVEKLLTTGAIRLANSELAGFNLGAKMSALSALTGNQGGGSNTTIQNLSSNVRNSPEGSRLDNINLTVPSFGTVTGAGTVSPSGALDFKMAASLNGGAVGGVTQIAGLGKGGVANLPFKIQGTTSNPTFVPDVNGILGGQLQNLIKGNNPVKLPKGLGGLFGKKPF